ncbi:MAG: hypothetical protein K0S12_1941, partial [Bacteroidetes bacterium]|nr:hypothetical protein [Bacteroidota bacterium]
MKKNVLSFLCILYVAVTFAAHSDGLNNDLYFT